MDFKSKRKGSGKLNSGSSIIRNLFESKESPLSEQFVRWKIWYSWPEYVGEGMAKNCLPVGYDRGFLFVWVKNSTWMHHLLFLKDDLQEKINLKLGRSFVRGIRFTLDRKEVPPAADPEWQAFIDMILSGPQILDQNETEGQSR